MRGAGTGKKRTFVVTLTVMLLVLGWVHAHAEEGGGRPCTDCALAHCAAVEAPGFESIASPETPSARLEGASFTPFDAVFHRGRIPRGPPISL